MGATRDVPDWLEYQSKYPEEMLIWKVPNSIVPHVNDPKAYLRGESFTPFQSTPQIRGNPTLLMSSHSHKVLQIEHLLVAAHIQLKDSPSKDLAGYMVVQNNLENLGNMTFYSIPTNSSVKLIRPELRERRLSMTAITKALVRN